MIRQRKVLVDAARSELPTRQSHCLLEQCLTFWLVQIEDNIDGPDDKFLPVEVWLFGVLGEFEHATCEPRPVDSRQGSDNDAVLDRTGSKENGARLSVPRRYPAIQRLPAA
jgi:hypothetical protein